MSADLVHGGLCEAVLAQVAAQPTAPAVVQDEQTLSYADLAAQAWRLAESLRAHGIGPEQRVGLCMRRTPSMAAAVLGVLLAGGAYVPTSPDDPEQRRATILDDAGVNVAIVDDHGRLALAGRVPVLVDVTTSSPGRSEPRWPLPRREQAAYVLYTSGSTGRPKGVVVEHGAMADFVAMVAEPAGIDAQTRALAFASLGFDVSVLDLLVPLAYGACVVLAGDADRTDPARLERLCQRHKVTWAAIPPALLPLLDPQRLPTLRRVVTAGEPPAPAQAQRWGTPPVRSFANWYGPTEATVVCVGGDVSGSWSTPLPLGLPLPGRAAYVLDNDGAETGEGELHIGGIGLARGYLGSPALTAQRFVPDPRSSVPGARMYRTGDLVRRQSDGTLVYLGRIDRQVKVRGQRVEIGEIEAVLAGHERIDHAVVDAVRSAAGELELVAYLTPSSAPDLTELAAYCRRRLSTSMMPSRVYQLESFPLNASSKIDMSALRGLDTRAPQPVELEIDAVRAAWQHEFGHAPEPDEDFFDSGGHSLTAMRLVARLRESTGRDLAVEEVLRARTAGAIAEMVRAASMAAPTVDDDDGQPELTPAQRRLWFMDRLAPHAAAYNVTMALRITGPLDVATLGRALGEVAARHEALRWRIISAAGRPAVLVDPPGPVALGIDDLTGAGSTQEGRLRQLLDAGASQPFDTSRESLWRAQLILLADDVHVLAVTVHHAVFDGWSQSVYLRDLGVAYRRILEGGAPASAAPGFSTYARWRSERSRLHGPTDVDWAVEHLSGEPTVPDLPRDRARPPVQTFGGAQLSVMIGDPAAVAKLAATCGATTSAVLLAAFAVMLRRLTGRSDLVLGVPIADRREARFDEVIGLLLDTVPVRVQVDDAQAFTRLVAACNEELLLAMAHREAPLDVLVDRLGLPRTPARNPLVSVLFNVLNTPPLRLELPGAQVVEVAPGLAGSPFDLTLYVQPQPADEIELRLVYNPDLFDQARMAALLADLTALLDQLAAAPDAALAFASTARPEPTLAESVVAPGVVESIAATCSAEPSRPAVDGVSRGQVMARAGSAAQAVSVAQLPVGAVVAVLAERCAWLPSILLGVLSSGARWVVLDQGAPTALLERQLRASGAVAALACPDAVLPARIRETVEALEVRWLDLPSATTELTAVAPAQRGYLTLTSGTTGPPLPVRSGEAALAHFLRWYPRQFGLGVTDRFAMLSGLGHDPLLREVFTPLVLGAQVCVPPPHTTRDPQRLAEWLRETGVTVLHATPPLIRLLGTARDLVEHPLPALRLVVSGGDQLTLADAALVRHFAPGARLVNAYGTTETPQIHAWYAVDWSMVEHHDWEPGRPVPVGTGATGTQLLVLDALGRPAGVGELGEVVVRSHHLADGYAGRDTEHARFSTVDGARQFRTGDLGRIGPAGAVTLAGRTDDQVSIRGHRVELAEVEAALAAHPDVAAAIATVVREDGEAVLVGYAVPTRPGLRPETLRAHLRSVLPSYAVPAAIGLLERIPVTPNGKPDRAALPMVERGGVEAVVPVEMVSARQGTERLVTGLWQAVLGVPVVGATQNFFDAGGHSLAMVEVASRLGDALGRPVEVVTLFRYPTARTLGAFLDQSAHDPTLDRLAAQIAERRARTRARRRPR
jgi:amino acid adenylation domain-containing protein